MVWVWVYWCFTSHGTIFQLYMWRHRCAGGLKKKLFIRSGSQRHRQFAGFFNVPVLHRHGTNHFIRWLRHTAPLVAFYDTLGIGRTYSKPPASSRGNKDGMKKIIIIKFLGYLQKHKTSCLSSTISCIAGNKSWLRNDSFKIKSEDLLVASATSLLLVVYSYPTFNTYKYNESNWYISLYTVHL